MVPSGFVALDLVSEDSVAPVDLPFDSGTAVIAADGSAVAFVTELDFDEDVVARWESYEPAGVRGRAPRGLTQLVVKNLATGELERISEDPAPGIVVVARDPDISADGRFVAYAARKSQTFVPTSLAAGPSVANSWLIRVHDRQDGTTTDLLEVPEGSTTSLASNSVDSFGGVSISDDGQVVAFHWRSSAFSGSICESRSIAFAVAIVDRRGTEGTGGSIPCSMQPDVAGNGESVAFATSEPGSNATDIILTAVVPWAPDTGLGVPVNLPVPLVSEPNFREIAFQPSISRDGSRIALTRAGVGDSIVLSSTSVLPVPYTEVLVVDVDPDDDGDLVPSEMTVSDVATGDGYADAPSISADGRYVAFATYRPLAADDGNRIGADDQIAVSQGDYIELEQRAASGALVRRDGNDVYVADLANPGATPQRISIRPDGTDVRFGGDQPSVSEGGRFTVFHSSDDGDGPSGYVPGDRDGRIDVFVVEQTGRLELTPDPVDFGTASSGDPPVGRTATVTNVGPVSAFLGPSAVAISGTAAADFAVATDGCSTRTLAVGATCAIDLTFTPAGLGDRTATLSVATRTGPISVQLVGRSGEVPTPTPPPVDPVLEIDPEVGPDGFLPLASGFNFEPGVPVELRWAPGTGVEPPVTVVPSAGGVFEVSLLVFPNSFTGDRSLEAVVGGDVVATVDYLVVLQSADPIGDDLDDLFRG